MLPFRVRVPRQVRKQTRKAVNNENPYLPVNLPEFGTSWDVARSRPLPVWCGLMSTQAIPAEIVHAAQQAVRSETALQAVLLFGSRARGDHRPDSDWDIALVTDTAGQGRSSRAPVGWGCSGGGATFDFLRISAEGIARKANSIAHIACPIAREAVLLAGNWQPPTLESPIMEIDEYARLIFDAEESMGQACTLLSSIPDAEYPQRDAVACGRFVTASADAAELLLKAMLGRRGKVPEHTHEVRKLAFDDPDIRAAALALDGHSRRDHTAHYHGVSGEDVRRAASRLAKTVSLYLFDFREATGGGESTAWAKEYLPAAEDNIRSLALRLRTAGSPPAQVRDEAVSAALEARPVLATDLEEMAPVSASPPTLPPPNGPR